MTEPFPVIYEDHELLVINKPAGLVCHPTKNGERSSLIGRIRLYLGSACPVHLVNRLDRETSGVVVVAKDQHAARELRRLWEQRRVRKEYWAIVYGHPTASRFVIDQPLGPDEHSAVAIKDCVRPDGAPAHTEVEVQKRFTRPEGEFALLHVSPVTGRKHQIRVHLAASGHPIVGDKLYGQDETIYLDFVNGRLTDAQRRQLILANQALHSHAIRFERGGCEFCFRAIPEELFVAFLEGKPHLSWGGCQSMQTIQRQCGTS